MAQEPETPDDPTPRFDLDELFTRNFSKVVNFFIALGVPRDLALDLAQETFLRAYKGRDQFRGETSEKTWLYEIARNLFKNWLRDRSALKKQGIDISLDHDSQDPEEPDTKDPDSPEIQPQLQLQELGPSFWDRILVADRNKHLQVAIGQLPPQRRLCLQLQLLGLTYSEIAATMGISIVTVKSHLYQARESLKRLISGLEGQP